MLRKLFRHMLRQLKHLARATHQIAFSMLHEYFLTRVHLFANRNKVSRRLDIGPGLQRIPGFETLDCIASKNLDYILDARHRLPFRDNTFEVIYGSHVLEHIPWYQTRNVLAEWIRIIEPGGQLEIWVPDGLKICKAFVDAELHGDNYIDRDGWYRFNEERDPCMWVAGRVFSYGDGTGIPKHSNWHRALFSVRYLTYLLVSLGLEDVKEMESSEVRGYDHGWINLGIKGTKPRAM